MLDKQAFLEAAALAARQIGVMARRLQGQVQNEGKQIDLTDTKGDDWLKRQKEAVTVVDQIAQDIIITALAPHLPLRNTVLDGEEDTPGKVLIPSTTGEYVLVLDPIDGTLIYLEGGNTYAVNIGLFKNGKVDVALLYFPALDVCYYTTGEGVLRAPEFFLWGLGKSEEVFLKAKPDNPKTVFVYYAIIDEVEADLKAAGYTIVRSLNAKSDLNYPDPMLAMMNGGVSSAIIGRMQVRDLIHGAILSCAKGRNVIDWQGQPYTWPLHGGELPKMLVTGWPLADDLKTILERHA